MQRASFTSSLMPNIIKFINDAPRRGSNDFTFGLVMSFFRILATSNMIWPTASTPSLMLILLHLPMPLSKIAQTSHHSYDHKHVLRRPARYSTYWTRCALENSSDRAPCHKHFYVLFVNKFFLSICLVVCHQVLTYHRCPRRAALRLPWKVYCTRCCYLREAAVYTQAVNHWACILTAWSLWGCSALLQDRERSRRIAAFTAHPCLFDRLVVEMMSEVTVSDCLFVNRLCLISPSEYDDFQSSLREIYPVDRDRLQHVRGWVTIDQQLSN